MLFFTLTLALSLTSTLTLTLTSSNELNRDELTWGRVDCQPFLLVLLCRDTNHQVTQTGDKETTNPLVRSWCNDTFQYSDKLAICCWTSLCRRLCHFLYVRYLSHQGRYAWWAELHQYVNVQTKFRTVCYIFNNILVLCSILYSINIQITHEGNIWQVRVNKLA